MALEKAMPFQQERNKEAIDAYAQNYGAHREGISMKEMAEYYTKWANADKYEVVFLTVFCNEFKFLSRDKNSPFPKSGKKCM